MGARLRMRCGVGRHRRGIMLDLITSVWRTGVRPATLALLVGAVCAAPAQAQLTAGNAGSAIGDLIRNLTGETAKPAPVNRSAVTEFRIAIAKPVQFQVFALTNPNRVVVEMPNVPLTLPRKTAGDTGLVTSFRGGRASANSARVIINVKEPVVVERASIETSKRSGGKEIVLDILPVRVQAARKAKMRAALRKSGMGLGGSGIGAVQPPTPQQAPTLGDLKKKTFLPLIVIDPGHGGKDSGAKKNGVIEKDVVLKFSLVLRDKLLKTGRYRVMMTRDDDRFIELIDRRRFAERHKAALFIAVHADYARAGARGATIYSLRQRVAKRLKQSAKRSVQKGVLTSEEARTIKSTVANDVGMVRRMLADLATREVEATRDRTDLFTEAVIKTMSRQTKMRQKPDREAAFKVLKSAKVPSVLIELAFVTNRQDAKLLKSEKWRNRVSGSIVSAVDNYFSHTVTRLPL
jgi:N-acetylmuramoyl-L-alanine amidase